MNRLAAANSPKVAVCACWRASDCNVNDTRALTSLCVLVTLHLNQIRDPWHSRAFTIAHIVIGLSLHIHSFIHLRSYPTRPRDIALSVRGTSRQLIAAEFKLFVNSQEVTTL